MGLYGAYREEARQIVDELRNAGILDEVMNRKDIRVPLVDLHQISEPEMADLYLMMWP